MPFNKFCCSENCDLSGSNRKNTTYLKFIYTQFTQPKTTDRRIIINQAVSHVSVRYCCFPQAHPCYLGRRPLCWLLMMSPMQALLVTAHEQKTPEYSTPKRGARGRYKQWGGVKWINFTALVWGNVLLSDLSTTG